MILSMHIIKLGLSSRAQVLISSLERLISSFNGCGTSLKHIDGIEIKNILVLWNNYTSLFRLLWSIMQRSFTVLNPEYLGHLGCYLAILFAFSETYHFAWLEKPSCASITLLMDRIDTASTIKRVVSTCTVTSINLLCYVVEFLKLRIFIPWLICLATQKVSLNWWKV